MSPDTFSRKFVSDLYQLAAEFPEMGNEAAIKEIFGMHHRHASQVSSIISSKCKAHADDFAAGIEKQKLLNNFEPSGKNKSNIKQKRLVKRLDAALQDCGYILCSTAN